MYKIYWTHKSRLDAQKSIGRRPFCSLNFIGDADYYLVIIFSTISMEYGVQTHNKFAFLDDDVDVSDPDEALSKKVEEAKKDAVTAALSAKKVTVLPPVTKLVAQKENEKPTEPPSKKVEEAKKDAVTAALSAKKGRYLKRVAPKKVTVLPPVTKLVAQKENEKPTEPPPAVSDRKRTSDGVGAGGDKGRGGGVENNAVEEVKEPEEEVEQMPREKTYEEWKNEQQQKNAEHIHFNTRKPGEGDDQKLYKELIPVKNPNAKEPKHGNESDESTQHKEKREKPLVIDLSFSDKRSGSGGGFSGFGDRGSGARGDRSRGGGKRGGMRGGPPRNNYVGGGSAAAGPSKRQQGGSFMLENEQFPALGAAH